MLIKRTSTNRRVLEMVMTLNHHLILVVTVRIQTKWPSKTPMHSMLNSSTKIPRSEPMYATYDREKI